MEDIIYSHVSALIYSDTFRDIPTSSPRRLLFGKKSKRKKEMITPICSFSFYLL